MNIRRNLGREAHGEATFWPGLRTMLSGSLAHPVPALIAALAGVVNGIIMILGAAAVGRVESGDLSVGVLVEVVYLLLTISIPLNVISRFLGMLPVSTAGRSGVAAVLGATETTAYGDRVLTGAAVTGAAVTGDDAPRGLGLRARGVELVRGGTRLLADVDLEVRPGEIVALVGPTGAGKSTLVDLLSRQIDPTDGVVEIGGVRATDLARGEISSRLAVVSQTSWLFGGSVLANLQLDGQPREGRPYTGAEIWRALAAAGADDVVRDLPDGLETRVGERGARLSGGQRQRLCLARALLREPRALLLDDATSALDPTVERRVLAGVADLRGCTTVLIVGGRPSSVMVADRVAFLRAGRLVAVGTHAELLAAEPDYRRILGAYPTCSCSTRRPAVSIRPPTSACSTRSAHSRSGARRSRSRTAW